MRLTDMDRRWLIAAVVAGCVCLLSTFAVTTVATDNTADEILSALAWLSAIAVVFSVVRGGVDAGVRRTRRESSD